MPGIYIVIVGLLILLNELFPPKCDMFGCLSLPLLLLVLFTVKGILAATLFGYKFGGGDYGAIFAGAIFMTIFLFLAGLTIDIIKYFMKVFQKKFQM